MSESDSETMDEGERDEFLGSGGTGVISLSTDEAAPHSTPVSYGYDAAEAVFYFRLANKSGGAKGDLSGRAVSFVTYGNDDGWKSVVATGSWSKPPRSRSPPRACKDLNASTSRSSISSASPRERWPSSSIGSFPTS